MTSDQPMPFPGETPAALIYRATWPNQKIYRGTLATLPGVARDNQVKPPTLIVIGSVVRLMKKHAAG